MNRRRPFDATEKAKLTGQKQGDDYEDRRDRRQRLIGSKLVIKLCEAGHATIAASPNSGVNTLTGEGGRGAERHLGGRRCNELPFMGRRGGAEVLRDFNE